MRDNFPKIPKIPEELMKILPKGQIIIFVGAGVSCLIGYPNWNTLADRLLKRVSGDDDIEYFSWADADAISSLSPRQKISIAIDIWKRNNKSVSNLLKEALTETANKKSTIHNLLASIPAGIVTTNYDTCLSGDLIAYEPIFLKEGALTGKPSVLTEVGNREVFHRKNEFTIDKLVEKNTIFYLHGIYNGDENSLVLTTRDYVEHYQDQHITTFLNHLFDKYNVIFIGYGLSEEEILEYVIRKQRARNEIKHFRLFPLFSHQDKLFRHLSEYYRNQCGVQLIPYLIDEKDHYQLEDVLNEWLPVLKEKIQPPGFIQKTNLILDQVLDDGTKNTGSN